MKYYKLTLKIHNETLDPDSPGFKVYPCANGEKVSNGKGYFWDGVNNGKIHFEKTADDTPIFDYYYLYNSSYQKEYDWILLDSYRIDGPNSLSGRGFMVSERLKTVLEQFKIAKPYRFYPAYLMYQGNKLLYYIMHLANYEWNEFDIECSTFEIGKEKFNVTNERDFRKFTRAVKENSKPWRAKIGLEFSSDLFYFSHIGYIVSEDLKNSITQVTSSDFEFELLTNYTFEFKR